MEKLDKFADWIVNKMGMGPSDDIAPSALGNCRVAREPTLFDQAWSALMPYVKYAWHTAFIILFPMTMWRFFLRYNDFDTQEMLLTAFLILAFGCMAEWSHRMSKQGNNPGYV